MDKKNLRFSALRDVPVREAWLHEAHHLTPWLADNLDYLGEAVGLQLDQLGTEQRVGPYSADILARDIVNDRKVLIENQLEASDHTHLGQVLTYLAGLETEVMIWVAIDFREEHLSAVRWLNEHTLDPFAFFAVKLRVLQIDDSPFAPLFEVVEQPNNWERRLMRQSREEGELSAVGRKRLEFWTLFTQNYPEEGSGYPADAASSRWRGLGNTGLVAVQFVSKGSVGVFVRPDRGVVREKVSEILGPDAARLAQLLGAELGPNKNGAFLYSKYVIDTDDRANWDEACAWLHQTAIRYEEVITAELQADRDV
ncbi:MAG: hypothetical protein RID07_08390 [Lacipirellulaceae bacterium]